MMKGKFTVVPGVTEGYVRLRYSWKDGESRRAFEYAVREEISPEEIAHELEKFAAMLREPEAPTTYVY